METEIAYWARFSKETLGSLDHGKNSLATFLDLATTFDPVFNCRLVKSIKDLGFDEVSFRWFSIYSIYTNDNNVGSWIFPLVVIRMW